MSTVPHSAGQSRIFIRCPASREMRQMSRIFFKWYIIFVADYFTFLPWKARQQSDELPIKLGSYFAHRQTPSMSRVAAVTNVYFMSHQHHQHRYLVPRAMGDGFRLDNRQRSSDNLHALFSIFPVEQNGAEEKMQV